MCGDYDSVIGMRKEEPIRRFVEKTPGSRYEPATGEGTLCGVGVEIERETGLAHQHLAASARRAAFSVLAGILGSRPDGGADRASAFEKIA